MRLHTLAAVALTVCALPVVAAELPAAPAPRAIPPRETKVFAVGDLVDEPAPKFKNVDQLLNLVTGMARPHSWEHAGGRGKAEFYEIGSALVVSNTPDVVREVGDLLDACRILKDPADPRAFCRAEPRQAVVVKLRNVAAADAAHAVREYLNGQKRDAVVTAEPVSNCVLVSGEDALTKQLLGILAKLDVQPPQVVVTAMIVQVGDDFVKDSGLGAGSPANARSWALSAREMALLKAGMREAQGKGGFEVLARPQLCLCDNQTGFCQVGQQHPVPGEVVVAGGVAKQQIEYRPIGVSMRATPRVAPDGRVLLRLEAETSEVSAAVEHGSGQKVPAFNKTTVQTTAELKPGETFVIHVGDKKNTLVFVTPTVVK